MKAAVQKPVIPPEQLFIIKELDEKHFDPVWHSHAEYQLFVVLEGTGTRFIGDNMQHFVPGELIFTGPHLPHLWRNDDVFFDKNSPLHAKGIVIYMSEFFLGSDLLEKEELHLVKKLLHRSVQGIEFLGPEKETVTRMMKELCGMKGLERVIQLLRMLHLLSQSKDYRLISQTVYEPPSKEGETDRMNQVYEYVLNHFRKKILLEDLAALLHMTPTSFSRYFTMKNNKPFSRFLAEIRIRHACKLLTESDNSIEQVCYECGYNTLSNFNRQFKEITHRTPLEYKKEFAAL